MSFVCPWFDDSSDDPETPRCGKPVTHRSCCWAGGDSPVPNVCEEHKCRCAQQGAAAAIASPGTQANLAEAVALLRSLARRDTCPSCGARDGEACPTDCKLTAFLDGAHYDNTGRPTGGAP